MAQTREQRREQNRKSQRRRRALERGGQVADARDFSRWFDLTSRVLQLKTVRAWSTCLAEIMLADDAHLRRVAAGKTKAPRLEMTYNIGEALREAGIPWCSGLYALYQHPKHFVEVYAVLDMIGADPALFAATFDWMEAAYGSRLLDDAFATIYRTFSDEKFAASTMPVAARLELFESARELVQKTTSLQSEIDTAWNVHVRSAKGDGKVHKVHNFFGGLYVIRTDPRFVPVAQRFYEILERELMAELRPDQREKMERERVAFEAARLEYEERHERAVSLLDDGASSK